MLNGHFGSAGESIEYGAADFLFPVDELDGTVLQYRDARVALDGVDGSDVICIAPTSIATSYVLTQHVLTATLVDTLSASVRAQIAEESDGSLHTFDLVQTGTWNSNSPNHSLAEFADT